MRRLLVSVLGIMFLTALAGCYHTAGYSDSGCGCGSGGATIGSPSGMMPGVEMSGGHMLPSTVEPATF